MTTINHECYVSLEVAKLLKEAGFNWEVKSYYKGLNGIFETTSISNNFNDGTLIDWVSAPTLEVVQKWLREVKRIFIHVSVYAVIEQGHEITDSDKFSVYAETWNSQSEFWNKWISLFEIDDFNTYEEAQEAGIKKVLEIILKKGK